MTQTENQKQNQNQNQNHKTALKDMFVLKSLSHGILCYKYNFDDIIKEYNKETKNGTYAGYSVIKIEVDREYNLNNTNDLCYIQKKINQL